MITPCLEWIEHPFDTPIIAANVAILNKQISESTGHREVFDLALPTSWHRFLHNGCLMVPQPTEYIGWYRGTGTICIHEYCVNFGEFRGVAPAKVPYELAQFNIEFSSDLEDLDLRIKKEEDATTSRINILISKVARAYTEWIRIHPFADGNGRTARVLVDWTMARYWQPLILGGRPPIEKDTLVSATTYALQSGDHKLLEIHFRRRLTLARKLGSKQAT